MVDIVEKYEDFRATYKTNHRPKYLTIEDKKSEVKIQIQNQHIKMCATKDMEMVNNIDYTYENIWGHCTDPLHNMIKQLDKFTKKQNNKDAIWLLKNLKTVST